ncbi:hypothetical protein UFOVP222_106 [uncultured Caudovirales phage]|uniref:Uncharacterized protein n=1 Tax=uncultured Caudovirales phage TaxID=2100421 RepID=A0A6J5TEW4_9CAUD|nr:hypothetical protein UFOVP108_101 [uncultured Caudovirales phage]CAB5219656.1 hypothetical protein UFOVP222_106 [uncultured Caudovirales phage]
MDEVVYEYREWYDRGKAKRNQEIVFIIDKMMEDPPMRGDIALNDLRRAIEEA